MSLFIMIVNPETYNTVVNIEEHIVEQSILEQIYLYIHQGTSEEKIYNIDDKQMMFSMNKFDSKSAGLRSNYDDCYEYTRHDIKYVCSMNESKLRAFCCYINRITHW